MQLGVSLGIPYSLGKPAAAFSPLDLSPILWLDASDTSTITEVGGAVSQWDNKGSLGNFVQGNAAIQPTTGVTTLNGKNVIDFAGDYMDSADVASAYNDLHNGGDWMWAGVVKYGTTANPNVTYALFGNSGGATANVGMLVFYSDLSPNSDMFGTYILRGGSGTVAVANSSNDVLTPNTFQIVSELLDPDNGTGADRSKQFVDGGTANSNNTSTLAPSAANATFVMELGANGNTGALALTGSIAELVIVTGANATEANRQALRDYLNEKWAVY